MLERVLIAREQYCELTLFKELSMIGSSTNMRLCTIFLSVVTVAWPVASAAAFDLSARKCFSHMQNPERAWNEYMPRCFNEKSSTSCGQAASNSRDPECLHDINLQLARIAVANGRHQEALQYARYAIRNADTAEAWITLGIGVNSAPMSDDERVKSFDEVIARLSGRRLDAQQSRAYAALKEQRGKAMASFQSALGRRDEANRKAESDFEALKARCGEAPSFDGKPTFAFGSGATNYLREAAAFARNISTGVVPELHDRRRSGGWGNFVAQSGTTLQLFVCVQRVKYVQHVTTRNSASGRVHVAEVQLSGVGRDLRDLQQTVELTYSD